MISLDEIFQETCELGRYQLFVLLLLCIPCCIMDAYYGFSYEFVSFEPDHRCKLFPNETSLTDGTSFDKGEAEMPEWMLNKYFSNSSLHQSDNATSNLILKADECSLKIQLNGTNHTEASLKGFSFTQDSSRECPFGWLYDDTDFHETIVTKWDLVCREDIYPKLGQSILSLTPIVLCFIIALIQDKYGRRTGYMIAISLQLAGGLLSTLAPNLITFFSILALSSASPWMVCYVWAMELVGPSKRTPANTLTAFVYAIGTMSIGLIAYLCKSWKQLIVVTTAPFISVLAFYWIIPESPRWLLANGKPKEAKTAIEKLLSWEPDAKAKRLRLAELLDANNSSGNTDIDNEASNESMCRQIYSLLAASNVRRKIALVTYATVATSLAYSTIAFNLENINGVNMYVAYTVQASMDMPAVVICILVLDRFGRVRPLAIAMILTGTACLLAIPDQVWPPAVILLFTVLAKLGSSLSYAILGLLMVELYPTRLCNTASTFTNNAAWLFNAAMPYIVYSGHVNHIIPMLVLASLTIVAGVAVLWLPETLHFKEIPQTVEDCERTGIVGRATFLKNTGCAPRNKIVPVQESSNFIVPLEVKIPDLLVATVKF